jgi:hypothetical protein
VIVAHSWSSCNKKSDLARDSRSSPNPFERDTTLAERFRDHDGSFKRASLTVNRLRVVNDTELKRVDQMLLLELADVDDEISAEEEEEEEEEEDEDDIVAILVESLLWRGVDREEATPKRPHALPIVSACLVLFAELPTSTVRFD